MERKSIRDTNTNNSSGRMKEVQLGRKNEKSLVNKPLLIQTKVIKDIKEFASAHQMKLQCGELKYKNVRQRSLLM